MPTEIFDEDEFIKLSETAQECRVKRLRDIIKLKLRTSRRLYTLKIDPSDYEGFVRRIKCDTIEV
jgi:hypothetical protein